MWYSVRISLTERHTCFCSFQASIWVCFVVWLLITGIELFNLWRMGALPCIPQSGPAKSPQNTPAENPTENGKTRY